MKLDPITGKLVEDGEVHSSVHGSATSSDPSHYPAYVPSRTPARPTLHGAVVSDVISKDRVKVERKPEKTRHQLHGSNFLVTVEQRAKYNSLLKEVNDAVDDRVLADIPLNDLYYAKKQQLDDFVATLSR